MRGAPPPGLPRGARSRRRSRPPPPPPRPRPPAPPLRPPHLEAGPERDRRCRTAPVTVRTRRSRPRSRSGRGRSAAEVRGARLPPRAGPRRPAPPPGALIGRVPRLTARERPDSLRRPSIERLRPPAAGEVRWLLGYGGGGTAGSEIGPSVCLSLRPSLPRGRLRARPFPCPAVPQRPLPPRPPSRPHHCRCKSAAPRPAWEHRLCSDRRPRDREGGSRSTQRLPRGCSPRARGWPCLPPSLSSPRPGPQCIPRGERGRLLPPPGAHWYGPVVAPPLSLRRFRPSAPRRPPW